MRSIAHLLGAALIITIGLYLVIHRTGPQAKQSEAEIDGRGRRWMRGFASAIFNPTLILTWTSAVTALHAASVIDMRSANALPFALGVGAGIMAWFALLVQLVRRFREHIQKGALDRVVRGMGWAMIAIGAVVVSRALLLRLT
jgi:threonine/homoserine/homoserine lactone efflux protein